MVPFFFKLNPNFDKTLKNNLRHISEQNTFIDSHIKLLKKEFLHHVQKIIIAHHGQLLQKK